MIFHLSAETEVDSLPVCNDQSSTSFLNHSTEEAGSQGTCPGQINGVASKEPALLRELDTDLLKSGKLQLTGKLLYLTVIFTQFDMFLRKCFVLENFYLKDTQVFNLFQLCSMCLLLTGTVDRLGRALVFTDANVSDEDFCTEEMARILACYHRITR